MGLRLVHSKSCPDCSAGEDLEQDHDKDCPRCSTCGQCVIGDDGWVPSDELHPDSDFRPWTIESWHEHLRKEHSDG